MHSSHHRHRNLHQQQRKADLVHILDPAYQSHPYQYSSSSPASTSSLRTPTPTATRVYADEQGNLHDPDFKYFPTDEWRTLQQQQQQRRSFEKYRDHQEEDTDEEGDEGEYAFGGRKSRAYAHPSSHVRRRPSSPTSPYTSPLSLPVPLPSLSPSPPYPYSYRPHSPVCVSSPRAKALTIDEPPHSAPLETERSPRPRTLRRRLFHRRRSISVDDLWDTDEEDEDDSSSEDVPSKPVSASQPTAVESTAPTCKSSLSDLRQLTHRRLQYLQLSVQFAIFRTKRRLSFT